VHSPEAVERALDLAAAGVNSCEISRRLGIPRSTIVAWRHGRVPQRARLGHTGACLRCAGYRFPVPRVTDYAYSYLLGLYLGDGHISHHPRGVFRLRIYLDRRYPAIVQECAAALAILVPGNVVSVTSRRRESLAIPGAYSRHWPCLFSQHGRGPKHTRSIELEEWQREIADRYPWRLLRGLIHSDGCRFINTIKHPKKTYRYPRYNFTNRSRDIRDLFCEYCDKVGVEWRQMNRWNISVARRESVALMDRAVGPKR
jgi:hypothetical protein